MILYGRCQFHSVCHGAVWNGTNKIVSISFVCNSVLLDVTCSSSGLSLHTCEMSSHASLHRSYLAPNWNNRGRPKGNYCKFIVCETILVFIWMVDSVSYHYINEIKCNCQVSNWIAVQTQDCAKSPWCSTGYHLKFQSFKIVYKIIVLPRWNKKEINGLSLMKKISGAEVCVFQCKPLSGWKSDDCFACALTT